MNEIQWILNSKFGPVYIVASTRGVRSVYFSKRQSVPIAESLEGDEPAIQILKATVNQLEEYFEGRRKEFDLPFDVDGTEFQKRVWSSLGQIPYGQTCSYTDIAKKMSSEKAVRAVGSANGRNPLTILVPCHRVIAANGTLGGYSGGLEIKARLLELERDGKH